MGAFVVVFYGCTSGWAMEMRLRPPLSSLHPPLSATAGENNVESSINRFLLKLNIRFELPAVRELAQKVGGVRH